ncbi:hypothetical protein HK102_001674 [Quaeritorhiza haematococci]|nr:hypothetical protein HK102_001674 [Quaeritorhiza haematococci]
MINMTPKKRDKHSFLKAASAFVTTLALATKGVLGNDVAEDEHNASPTTSPDCTKFYTVAHGDICWNIWYSNALTQSQFLDLNPGLNCRALALGTKVCVSNQPQLEDLPGIEQLVLSTEPAGPKTVMVLPGTTCWSIWNENQISERQLMEFNPKLNCGALEVGQELYVEDPSSRSPYLPEPVTKLGA